MELNELTRYRKYIVALAGAAVAILGRRLGVDSLAYLDVVAILTAFGVYATPNT